MAILTNFNIPDFKPFGAHEDLIHQILPKYEVCIVAGASGVGKSTWLFQMLKDWQEGKLILGYQSYPEPFCYVSNDRSLRSTMKTLHRMDVMCPFIVTQELYPNPKTVPAIIKIVRDRYPETNLLVLDTFAGFGPENLNNNRQVTDWLQECGRLCRQHKITILGAMHTAKVREDNKIKDPRQRVLGSVAIGGFSETIFCFEALDAEENPDTREYKLWVMPRHGKEEEFIFSKDDLGKFVVKERQDIAGSKFVLDTFLTVGKEFTTQDALTFGKRIPRRTVEKWLTDCVQEGMVIRNGKGSYFVPAEPPQLTVS